jgi:formate/nitrite transporter FocA (FNT family)
MKQDPEAVQPAGAPDSTDEETTELKGNESKEAERRTAPRAAVVYEAIRREATDELERPSSGLFFSGLAAGLSMGFSMVAEGLIAAHLPESNWRILVSKFGYSIGFLIVILGRQQLFTENTLTPIIQLLRHRDLSTFYSVARLWGIVLLANLMGAVLFAWVASSSDVFSPTAHAMFAELGQRAIQHDFTSTLISGTFAGWLIALMVWLLPFAETARVVVIIIITYIVGIGEFAHSIAGSVETLYLVTTGVIGFSDYATGFLIPTLLGNIIGGVALVAVINHAQVVAGEGIEG